MYSIDWSSVFSGWYRSGADRAQHPQTGAKGGSTRRRFPAVSGTVWALGVTSLFTDISSEMVASILPLYLVLHLGMSPLAFGVVDGLYQGAAALVRVAAGIAADRWGRYKGIAATGYALSAACRLLLMGAGNAWSTVAAVIMLDRLGKGIRTGPRDALISQRSAKETLATAFGVHRALDAAGAMLGPVVAFSILAMVPGRYDVLFVASFGIAVVGLGAIVLLVPATAADGRPQPPGNRVSVWNVAAFFSEPPFRAFVLVGCCLALATISDAFVFLLVQRRLGITALAFPLLYVGTSLSTSIFAIPAGRLADRLGRGRVLLGGYGLLGGVYVALLLPPIAPGPVFGAAVVILLGAYYASTDGVLTAMTAGRLAPSRVGSGLSMLVTATNLSRLAASVVFGALWSAAGPLIATAAYLGALGAALVVAYRVLPPDDLHA